MEWASATELAQEYWAQSRGGGIGLEWRFVRGLMRAGGPGALAVIQALVDEVQGDDELSHVGQGPLQDLICVDGHGARFIDDVSRRAAEQPRFRIAVSALNLVDDADVWFDVPVDVRARLAQLGARTGRWSMTDQGQRSMHPSRAALGDLENVSPHLFALIARHWMQDGFDSQPLRELAALPDTQYEAARELMPEVLASIGFPIPTEAEFAARCDHVLAIVQHDLDATGYGEYVMHATDLRNGEFSMEMFAALQDGASVSGGGGAMAPDMDEQTLLWHAAASTSDTLFEAQRIAWPICAEHDGQPMAPPNLYEAPNGLIDGTAWWWCKQAGGHQVAPVGQLTTRHAKAR